MHLVIEFGLMKNDHFWVSSLMPAETGRREISFHSPTRYAEES